MIYVMCFWDVFGAEGRAQGLAYSLGCESLETGFYPLEMYFVVFVRGCVPAGRPDRVAALGRSFGEKHFG